MPKGSFLCSSSGLSDSIVLASLFHEKKESGSTPSRASTEEGDRSSLHREVLVEASEGPVAVEDNELANDMDSIAVGLHLGRLVASGCFWLVLIVFYKTHVVV